MAKSGIANRTEKRRSNATTASMASPAFHSPNASQNDPKIPSSTSAASDDEEFFIAAERQLVAEAIASPSKKEVTGTKRRNLKKYSKKRAGKELNPEDRAQKKRDTKADGMQVFTSEDNAENEDENDLNETNNDEEDEIDLDENDVPIEKWTVQEFRGSKIDKEGEIYIQVKWEGHKDLTWEPEFNLKLDVPGRLAEYYESHGGRLKVLRNLLDIQTQGKKVTNKMKKGGKGKR